MAEKLLSVTQHVIDGTNKFFVPPYQRPYKWKAKEVKALINDIQQSVKDGDKEYFIGSIICIEPNDDNDQFEIVDGQQRLITLTLILLELAKRLEEESENVAGDFRRFVVRVDDLKGRVYTPTLKVREEDNDFYKKYILGDEIPPSNLVKTSSEKTFIDNKEMVEKMFSGMKKEEIRDFADHLRKKVKVVFIKTDNLISSYRLFNVLNNRGLPLFDSDLIKNELLRAAHGKNGDSEQAKEVGKNWRKTEELVGEDNLNDFLALQVVSEKKDRDRAKGRSRYIYFKKKLDCLNGDSVKVSEDLLRSAKNRNSFREGELGEGQSGKSIRFLKRFAKPSDWEPAFMAFLNRDDLRDKFPAFVRSFEMLYMHCFLGSNQGEAVCYHAVEAINNGKAFDGIISHISVLAQNEKLEKALDSDRFYDPKRRSTPRIVKAILLRIEDERHDESYAAHYALDGITVEHILPQEMSNPYWRSRFSQKSHEDWCHKLGNLTLLLRRKNSTARNLGFDEKKVAYQMPQKRSSESTKANKPLEITKEICDLSEWDFDALKARHERLKKELLDLWRITSEDSRKNLLDSN